MSALDDSADLKRHPDDVHDQRANKVALQRLMFLAASVTCNWSSAPHRAAAAHEATQIRIEDLIREGEARARMSLAMRETLIALALLSKDDARRETALALQSLRAAIRAEPRPSAPAQPNRWWLK